MDSLSSKRVLDVKEKNIIEIFLRIDHLLSQAEDMLVASKSHSPFNPYLTPLPANQARVVSDSISELRTVMLCVMRDMGASGNAAPYVNLNWALRSTFAAAARVIHEVACDQQRFGIELASSDINVPEYVDPFERMERLLAQIDNSLTTNGPKS